MVVADLSHGRAKYRAYAAASFDLANNLLKSAWFASLALSRTILETNQELLRAGGERPDQKQRGGFITARTGGLPIVHTGLIRIDALGSYPSRAVCRRY